MQAGLGKTRYLATIAACHGAALLESEGRPAVSPVARGSINGRTLRDEYRYARVLVIRLRDARLTGDDSSFTRPGLTVAQATAVEVARLLDVSASIAAASPTDLAAEFFEADAPRTLWLLDGFDEVPGAAGVSDALTPAIQTAFQEARDRKLAAPSTSAVEVAFSAMPASSILATARWCAFLRVLLCQADVILSSRPELESRLGPFTGYSNPRVVRLEPLSTKAVWKFVRGALTVRRGRDHIMRDWRAEG